MHSLLIQEVSLPVDMAATRILVPSLVGRDRDDRDLSMVYDPAQ